jgi:ATP synthase protein I
MTDKDERLSDIRETITKHKVDKNAADEKQAKADRDNESMGMGLRAGAEFVTAIIAGCLLGYYLDLWLDTKPIFFIALLILGVITGFVNVWRTSENIGHAVGYKDSNKTDKTN